MPVSACAHCKERKEIHARGLCGTCYQKPHVRGQYRADGTLAGGAGQRVETPTRKPRPTKVQPGTPKMVDVMARRFSRREELYHDRDGGRELTPAEERALRERIDAAEERRRAQEAAVTRKGRMAGDDED